MKYDIIVIGAGVVGSAIARELSRFKLKIAVLEKNHDVCFETSSRNSAVIHGGFAYEVGTNKAKFCVEGCLEFDKISEELGVPFKRTGKVLVGNTTEDYESLNKTIDIGRQNGAVGLEIIDEQKLHELVPAVNGKFAMFSPMSGIVDPFEYNFALAENAIDNGVDYFLNNEVISIDRVTGFNISDKNTYDDYIYKIQTNEAQYRTKWVINSAGLNAPIISDMLGIKGYKFVGTRGHYIVLDKKLGNLLPMPVYPVPSTSYMGIHVTPTIDGNITVGPDAKEVSSYENYGVDKSSIDYLASDAMNLWPHIDKKDYIRNYSGIQPKWVEGENAIKDFVIELRDVSPNVINLIGIESPALTSALPIARECVRLLKSKIKIYEKENFNPIRKYRAKFSELSDEKRAELIAKNPDYGEIICRCEMVSKAEILEALDSAIKPRTMLGVKYRTRSMMGRCQGGYCQMRIAQIIQEHTDIKRENLLYSREKSNMFKGRLR